MPLITLFIIFESITSPPDMNPDVTTPPLIVRRVNNTGIVALIITDTVSIISFAGSRISENAATRTPAKTQYATKNPTSALPPFP